MDLWRCLDGYLEQCGSSLWKRKSMDVGILGSLISGLRMDGVCVVLLRFTGEGSIGGVDDQSNNLHDDVIASAFVGTCGPLHWFLTGCTQSRFTFT